MFLDRLKQSRLYSLAFMEKFYDSNRIDIFDELYRRKINPVSITPCPSELRSFMNSKDFKQMVHIVFGFSSPKLVKLIAEKLVIEVKVDEYLEDVAQPSYLKSVKRRIVKLDGNPAYKVDSPNYSTGSMFVSGYEPSKNLLKQKKEYHIDYSLLQKGLYVNGLLTIDHLHTMVESHKPYFLEPFNSNYFSVQQLKDFFSFFTPYKIMKIVTDPKFFNNRNLMSDTIEQYSKYNRRGCNIPDDWKGLQELHDKISDQVALIKKSDKGKPFDYNEMEKKLHNYKVSDRLTLVLPYDFSELGAWALSLRNCAGSYDERISDKKTLLVGVLKFGEIKYLLEIRNTYHDNFGGYITETSIIPTDEYRITQFVENCNKPLTSQEDHAFISKAITLWSVDKLTGEYIGQHKEDAKETA